MVCSRLVLIFVLPLDFHGRVRVVRSMYLPAALHGIEASLLASDSLRKHRSAVCRAVWSRTASAAEIGFVWDSHSLAWVRPGLPLLSNLAGPIQHFRAAILDAWRNKVASDLCRRQGFRGGPLAGCLWFLAAP